MNCICDNSTRLLCHQGRALTLGCECPCHQPSRRAALKWVAFKYSAARGLAVLTLSTALFTACGGTLLTSFRVAVASSRPFIDSLVRSGTISQTKATAVIADVNDGIAAASRGEQCLTAATGSGNEGKIAKAKCYFQVAQDLRAILGRHNIGGNDKLTQIADVVSGAIAAFEEFFRNTTGPQMAATTADPEKVLRSKMESLNARMKQITQH